jgi:hypothetical protein
MIGQEHLDHVKLHLARALYAQEWADWADQAGGMGAGIQIMDQLGPVAEKYLTQAAKVLAEHEKKNWIPMATIVRHLAEADGADPTDMNWLEELGHDLGMMATGSGVSWFDDHAECLALDLSGQHVYFDGTCWDEPDAWYGRPITRYNLTFADGDVWRYAFCATTPKARVLEVLRDHFKDMSIDPPTSIKRVRL